MRNCSWLLLLITLAYGASAATPPWYSCDCSTRNNCMCPSTVTPGGLKPKDVPQFILFTHDDGITELTEKSFREVADGRQNPNGCPVTATMFTTSQNTDCKLAYGMWKDGYEIATHTADHAWLRDGTPLNVTVAQILRAKRFLSEQCGIPADEIRGFRNPYLVTNPVVRQVLFENGFLYDSTLLESPSSESLSASMAERAWPFTMDFGIAQNCDWFKDTQVCDKSERWPGLWEVPLWVLQVLGLEFTMDVGYYGGKGVYQPLKAAFDEAYNGNRAPLPIYIHTTWVQKQPARLDELKEFMDYTLSRGDVYWVTMSQMIQWIKNPVPASELSKAMCAKPPIAPAPPPMPQDGANVTLGLNGATRTQVADQSDRLIVATAKLLGVETADVFVAAVAGGPASGEAVATRRLMNEGGSVLQVTLVAAGPDPLALHQQGSAVDRQEALVAELAAMGLQLGSEPVVLPFKGGVVLSTDIAPPVAAAAAAPAPQPAQGPSTAAAVAPIPAAATTGVPSSAPDAEEIADGAASANPPATSQSSSSSSSVPTTTAAGSSSGSGSPSTGVIVGITFGGVAIAVLLALVAFVLLRRVPQRCHSPKLSTAGSIQEESPENSPTKQSAKDASQRLHIVATAV